MADNEFTDAKDGLKQEAPEMITRTIKVEGLTDLDKLVEEMEKIDEDQTNNVDVDKQKLNQCVTELTKLVTLVVKI